MEQTPNEVLLDHIRKLEAERQRLKEQALAKATEGVAELNAMGLRYELRERRIKPAKKERLATDSDEEQQP